MGTQQQHRQQKKKARHQAARKAKQADIARVQREAALQRTPGAVACRAEGWPVHSCYVTSDWREHGMVALVVARKGAGPSILAACYLVDLYCLGLKDTWVAEPGDEGTLRSLCKGGADAAPLEPCDPALAARIIRAGIDYAAALGLPAHSEFVRTRRFLTGIDADACAEEVPVGHHGKPLLVPGPRDNAAHLMAHLTSRLGPGGFDWIGSIG
jgi:hypothetical protein